MFWPYIISRKFIPWQNYTLKFKPEHIGIRISGGGMCVLKEENVWNFLAYLRVKRIAWCANTWPSVASTMILRPTVFHVSHFICTSTQPWILLNPNLSHQITSSVNVLHEHFRWKLFLDITMTSLLYTKPSFLNIII